MTSSPRAAGCPAAADWFKVGMAVLGILTLINNVRKKTKA
jgi:hypothetical protein